MRRTWIVVAERVDDGQPETLTFTKARIAVRQGWLQVTCFDNQRMLFPADRVRVVSEVRQVAPA